VTAFLPGVTPGVPGSPQITSLGPAETAEKEQSWTNRRRENIASQQCLAAPQHVYCVWFRCR